jgi:flagellar protein FlaJ
MKLRAAAKREEPEPQPAQGPAPAPAVPAAPGAPGAQAAEPQVLYANRMVQPLLPPKQAVVPARAKQPQRRQGMTEFQRTAFRLFGKVFTSKPVSAKLEESLRQARTGVRPEALQSTALMVALMAGVAGAMVTLFFAGLFVPLLGIELPAAMLLLFLLMPGLAALGGYAGVLASPGARARSRSKDIDMRLPYALNYIAAMASAGVNIDTIFKSLAEQRIYGEVAREADALYRDIHLFGKDTVTAFKRAIARTPSQRFAELLQGAITTFSSGGDLQLYFAAKAQRYMIENRQVQKQYVETMGLMAETYVTTAVAGPLFLMVMMAIMGMLSGQGPGQLYLIVYLMLPVANFGFVYGLYAMTPKV